MVQLTKTNGGTTNDCLFYSGNNCIMCEVDKYLNGNNCGNPDDEEDCKYTIDDDKDECWYCHEFKGWDQNDETCYKCENSNEAWVEEFNDCSYCDFGSSGWAY